MHFCQIGRAEQIEPMRNYLRRIKTRFVHATSGPSLRIGVFCHVFYPELTEEICAHLKHIPDPVDVLISTDSEEKKESILSRFGDWKKGKLEVRIAPNLGRDIAPRLTLYRHRHDRYDLVLYIHTKRGQFVVDGEEWRRYLFQNLVGSEAGVRKVIETFRRDSRLGMLISRHWPPVTQFISWGGNFEIAKALAIRLGLSTLSSSEIDFPSGSMFWARPAALKPLLDLDLTVNDFDPELGQVDGTLAHAIERLFLISCDCAGYGWSFIS